MEAEIGAETGWVGEVARRYRCPKEGVVKMMGQILATQFNQTITDVAC